MNTREIARLYEYNRWANGEMLAVVAPLPPEQFIRELGGSFRSVRDTLVHILSAEEVWLERWQGRSPRAMLTPTDFPDVASLRPRWGALERGQQEFLRGLTDAALKNVVGYVNFKGQEWRYALADMLVHLVNHSTYHRGQVTTMLRQLGAQPAATDFLLYLDVLAK